MVEIYLKVNYLSSKSGYYQAAEQSEFQSFYFHDIRHWIYDYIITLQS